MGAVAGQGGTAVDKNGNVVRDSGGNVAHGDLSGGNARVKSTSGAIIRDAQQEMRRIEMEARKCNCPLR